MDFTVYRQASKIRPDGTVVYKGEDALPYTDSQLYMVADGLGGAAAIRHTKFLPELFDEDKTAQVLFGEVYPDASEGSFADYVKRSFAELYAVKDCYTDNVNNIKKSGYFASRIVTAAVLHEVSEKGADYFFSSIDNAEDKKAALDDMGAFFAGRIREVLCKAAESANIIYESSYAGMALLGTTLCAGIVREKGDGVDVILVTAGDSRPYSWTESNGLCQLVADEERADGGMTNYIKANEGESFTIDCRFFTIGKPCMLINASDGCFDSSAFLSPMAFEKQILESIAGAESISDAGKALEEFFLDHGRHDDSSTMAVKTFGFADMASLKKAANNRLDVLKKTYLSRLGGLLTNDYIGMLSSGDDAHTKLIKAVSAEVRDTPEVKGYCADAVRESVLARIDSIGSDEIAAVRNSADVQAKLLRSLVTDNLRAFVYSEDGSLEKMYEDASLYEWVQERFSGSDGADGILSGIEAQAESAAKIGSDAKTIAGIFSGLSDDMELFVPASGMDSPESLSSDAVSDAKQLIDTFIQEAEAFRSSAERMSDSISGYKNANLEAAEEKPELADMICALFVSGDISEHFGNDTKLIGCTFDEMTAVADIVRSADERIEELKKEAVENETVLQAEKFWSSHAAEIIDNIRNGRGEYPDDMKKIIAQSAERNDESDDSLEADAKLQKEIFDEYYEEYSSIMRGESK